MVDEIFLKNIIREIIRECMHKGIKVTENFVRYYVKLNILDPQWGITSDLHLTRQYVQRFVKHCVYALSYQDLPSMVVLKMQLFFSNHFTTKEDMVRKQKDELEGRLLPLLNEISETEGLDDDEARDKYYKKMIYYITLLSGLGNPAQEGVYGEAEAAFKSIFFPSDLKEYLALNKSKKEVELVELMKLVAGIRIFNKDCLKGGDGIEDLPQLLREVASSTISDIQGILVAILDMVNLMTTAIDSVYRTKYKAETGVYYTECVLPEGVSMDKVDYYKDLLLVYRQYELYVRKILVEVETIAAIADDLFNKLQGTLLTLHNTCRYRTSIPVAQVFPLFTEIWDTWSNMQNETIVLAKLNQIIYNLDIYVKQFGFHEQILTAMIGENEILTDEERLALTNDLNIEITNKDSDLVIIRPGKMDNFANLPVEYLGFCAWKLVETQGGLIPGNVNMGVCYSNNLYFAFSSPTAAEAFGKTPETFILKVFDMARKKPELIHFLQLHKHLERLKDVERLIIVPPELIKKYDVEVQTEVHPIPTKIDPNYMWNVWDWKRQALKLADVSRKVTHATQTEKTYFRSQVRVQTQELRNKLLQTKKDNYTNVPTLSNFIYGLRGRKDDKQFVIALTRPVEE